MILGIITFVCCFTISMLNTFNIVGFAILLIPNTIFDIIWSGIIMMKKNNFKYVVNSCYLKSVFFFGLLFIDDLLVIIFLNMLYKNYTSLIFEILVFIFEFHLLLCIHEIGHFMIYVLKKKPIDVVYIFPFQINFKNKRQFISLKIEINYLGMVIPEISQLDEKIYLEVKKNLYTSYLFGPVMNFLLLMGAMIFLINRYNYICLFGIIINILMILMAFEKKDTVLGDFCAYKFVIKNDMYCAQLIYNYCLMSGNEFSDNNKNFLIQKFETSIVINKYNNINKRALLYLIQEELRCEDRMMKYTI